MHQLKQVLVRHVVNLLSGSLEKLAESTLYLGDCISHSTFLFAFFRARSRPCTSFLHKITWSRQLTEISTVIDLGLSRVRASGGKFPSFLLEARVVRLNSRWSHLLHFRTILILLLHVLTIQIWLRSWSHVSVTADGVWQVHSSWGSIKCRWLSRIVCSGHRFHYHVEKATRTFLLLLLAAHHLIIWLVNHLSLIEILTHTILERTLTIRILTRLRLMIAHILLLLLHLLLLSTI